LKRATANDPVHLSGFLLISLGVSSRLILFNRNALPEAVRQCKGVSQILSLPLSQYRYAAFRGAGVAGCWAARKKENMMEHELQ
jgi:hypothetical protein